MVSICAQAEGGGALGEEWVARGGPKDRCGRGAAKGGVGERGKEGCGGEGAKSGVGGGGGAERGKDKDGRGVGRGGGKR